MSTSYLSTASLAEVAASVAKVLGEEMRDEFGYINPDGGNLCDYEWQVRCRDWLLKRGVLGFSYFERGRNEFVIRSPIRARQVCIDCPAAEFCARAIHQMVTEDEAREALGDPKEGKE